MNPRHVPDGLLVVAEAVVGVAQEVTRFRLSLDIVELLAEHEVGLVEGDRLAELAPAGVAVACACAKGANHNVFKGRLSANAPGKYIWARYKIMSGHNKPIRTLITTK